MSNIGSSSLDQIVDSTISLAATSTATIAQTSIVLQDNFATYLLYRAIELIFGRVPWFIYQMLTYTFTATVTLDFWGFLYLSIFIAITVILLVRSRVLDQYNRLQPATNAPRNAFDLKPDFAIDDTSQPVYPDEFMNAFLSSIKVFGYLDKPVFHELARSLQTKKLVSGQVLFDTDSEDRDFYVVVEGKIQIFIKGNEEEEFEEDHDHLLNEVKAGGTVTSLFSILSILCEDLELPAPLATLAPMFSSTASLTPSILDDEKFVDTKLEFGGTKSQLISSPTDTEFQDKYSDASSKNQLGKSTDVPKNKPNIKQSKKSRSVHPNLIARASQSTTLAVIPASAFRKLSEKFPEAASHMAQVILTRFQRVTFLTLHRYLGLSSELLSIEKKVNEISGTKLPPDFFGVGVIETMLWRMSRQHTGDHFKENESYTDAESFDNLKHSDSSDQKYDFKSKFIASPPLVVDADEILNDAIFHCIAQLIGLTPSKGVSVRESPLKRKKSSFHNPIGSSVERFYYSTRRSSIASISTNGNSSRRSSAYIRDIDDASVSSFTSSLEDQEISNSPDVQILFFKQDDILLNEGDRSDGLYFVLDGTIEASTSTHKEFESMRRKWDSDEGLNPKPRSVFLIQPGGLASYLAALTGNSSFVTLRAKTDVLVGMMPKAVLDRYVEKYPNVLLCLAKRLVNQLSQLVFHIDVALEWGQVNAGQTLCRQGDRSHSIFIVLNGRLRSIRDTTETKDEKSSSLEIQGEYGQSESVGELEVLIDAPRPATIHAIRDTEVAIMPKTLFNALAIRHPEILLTISRMIAFRSQVAQKSFNSLNGANNENLKTVALLPVSTEVPILAFAEKLHSALVALDVAAGLVDTRTITNQLGKHAFTRLGRLKLLSWLAEQEETHRIVLYVADGGVNSPWTHRCIRQADCVLVVGLGDSEPFIGDYEQLLMSMKTTARKELVLLHSERTCKPGSTAAWLKLRLWIHAHHHIQLSHPATAKAAQKQPPPKQNNTITILSARFQNYVSPRLRQSNTQSPNIYSGIRSDFSRLGRRLLSRSIGLVLGGGGARGLAHAGIIRAFEEVGIPLDMIGGTSMGAFIGGVYARENDQLSVYTRCKQFCNRMKSTWRILLDVTYPIIAWTTGHEFNKGIWKVFFDTQIEDCWLPFYAISTNITFCRMEVHQQGYMWRYIRSSMSLSGFVPPLCDNGSLLLDGGYLNNVPADVMKNLGAKVIVAVDVGLFADTSPVDYGDTLSGIWVLFNRFNPFGKYYGKIPQISDIQSLLAYASSVPVRELISKLEGCHYLTPPIQDISILDFGKFVETEKIGYDYARKIIEDWNETGILREQFGLNLQHHDFARRASI